MTTLQEVSRELLKELRRIEPEQPGEMTLIEREVDDPLVVFRLAVYLRTRTLGSLRLLRVAVVRAQKKREQAVGGDVVSKAQQECERHGSGCRSAGTHGHGGKGVDAAHAAAGGDLCRPYGETGSCVDCGVLLETCEICGGVGYHRAVAACGEEGSLAYGVGQPVAEGEETR